MSTAKANMLNGELYDASDPELVGERERACDLTRRYNRTTADAADRRRELLDDLLGSHAKPCSINPPFRCDYGSNIHVGDGLEVNFDCVVLDVCRVEVGDNVWIGGHATINPGVTVGDDAVISSGAVVTADVPEGVVVGGNPATVIKDVGAIE